MQATHLRAGLGAACKPCQNVGKHHVESLALVHSALNLPVSKGYYYTNLFSCEIVWHTGTACNKIWNKAAQRTALEQKFV